MVNNLRLYFGNEPWKPGNGYEWHKKQSRPARHISLLYHLMRVIGSAGTIQHPQKSPVCSLTAALQDIWKEHGGQKDSGKFSFSINDQKRSSCRKQFVLYNVNQTERTVDPKQLYGLFQLLVTSTLPKTAETRVSLLLSHVSMRTLMKITSVIRLSSNFAAAVQRLLLEGEKVA